MSRTDQFISSLKNFELSFLRKYKLKSYLKATQYKILAEIQKRGLSEQDQNALMLALEFNPDNTGCPRCNSHKTRNDQIDISNEYAGGGIGIAYWAAAVGSGHDLSSKGEKQICEICGYVLKDDEKKDFGF
jgi:rubredoxin